jgi:hypothetical protein
MNNRIKEFKQQSGIQDNPDQEGLDLFAELIVKECATYMNGRTEDWDAKLRWIFNDGSGYMEVNVDSLLNEHFGVEE